MHDNDLDVAIERDHAFNGFYNDFNSLYTQFINNGGDYKNFNVKNYSKIQTSFDKLQVGDNNDGLRILINDITAAKIEVTSYKYCSTTKEWNAEILFTFYDDFGLDHIDVLNLINNNSFMGWANNLLNLDKFKAWYILQHFKCRVPFITEVKILKKIHGKKI